MNFDFSEYQNKKAGEKVKPKTLTIYLTPNEAEKIETYSKKHAIRTGQFAKKLFFTALTEYESSLEK